MNSLTCALVFISLVALGCGDADDPAPVDAGLVDGASTDSTPADSEVAEAGPDASADVGEGVDVLRRDAGPSLAVVAASTLSAANDHSCALGSDGALYCWGYNQNGELGDGTVQQRTAPVQVLGGTGVVGISASGHNCLIRGTNVECWGNNLYGQLGDGTIEDSLRPLPVGSLSNVLDISTGGVHSCALLADRTLWCWGGNLAGEIGSGTLDAPMGDPVQVVDLENAATVKSSGDWTCALRGEGIVYCWGRNIFGQLGNGTMTQSPRPVQVSGLDSVVDIAVGSGHACAVRDDGTVWCWGWNEWAQLGIGETDGPRTVPVQAIGIENAVDAVCGDRHTCALGDDGMVRCWGSNFVGELGDGGGGLSTESVVVAELTGVTEIAAGSRHTCARSDSGVYCWGINGRGQSGFTEMPTRTPNRIELP